MKLFRLYAHALALLGSDQRVGWALALANIALATAQFADPILFGHVILKASDSAMFDQLATMTETEKNAALDELIRRVIVPYACVGTVLFGLGLFVRYSPLPEINTEQESAEVAAANTGKTSIFQFPHLILGAVAIFSCPTDQHHGYL